MVQWILWEWFAEVFSEHALVGVAQFDHAFQRDVGVFGHFVAQLDLVERLFKVMVVDAADNIAVHVDQPTVGVIGKTLLARGVGQAYNRLVVQPQVENRVHHARHGDGSTRTDRHQQWRLRIAEFLAEFLFQHGDIFLDRAHQSLGQLTFTLVVEIADLRGDRETRRHGQADTGHFGQVGAFAAEPLFLFAVAFGLGFAEVIDHLGSAGGFLGHG